MRDELKEERERKAQAYYQQVRLFADKHNKKKSMAYMSTKERFPSVFIPPEWQDAPTPVGIDLDADFEQEMLDRLAAWGKANAKKGRANG